MSVAAGAKTRLETWKEIATFFRRDERTVKRWEVERGLPIHRLPGLSRSRIYAEVAELEAWLKGSEPKFGVALSPGAPAPGAAPMTEPGALQAAVSRRAPLAAAALTTVAALAGLARWVAPTLTQPASPSSSAEPAAAMRPPLDAQRLYLQGMDDWRARTPDSLTRAVDEFRAAIRIDPNYAEAYAGLANCYNLMREFTLMPTSEAYPLAKAAAERALALDPNLPEAHTALAFVDFYWAWDAKGAEREFERAIELDPSSATAHHWFATFLSVRGQYARSIAEIDKAAALDPQSLAIVSDRAFLVYLAGRKEDGMAALKAIGRAHPEFLSPHNYLARIAYFEGRDQDFIDESRRAAALTGDRQRLAIVAAASRGYAASGHTGLLRAVLEEQIRQFRLGVVTPYRVAQTCALLGDSAQAISYLQLAFSRREEDVTEVAIDPALASLHSDPQFQALTAQLS
ncbi:MAG: tetratricopeptide repeat protein [Caulobacterales bacterium]